MKRVHPRPSQGHAWTRSSRLGALLLIVVTACGGAAGWETGVFDESEITVGGETLTVAVADTPEKRARGLMEVEELPESLDGMLFVFEEPRPGAFHMLNTPMPLDIWWFDAEGLLIGSAAMEPCPLEPCVSYGSPAPVKWVLETPSGAHEFDPGEVLSTG